MTIKPEQYNTPPLGSSIKVPHIGCTVSNSASMRIEHSPKGIWFYCHACKEHLFIGLRLTYGQYHKRVNEARQAEMQKKANKDWSIPADASHDLPIDALVWLAKMRFGPATISEYCIQYSESLDRVILPLPTGWIGRCLDHKDKGQAKYYAHSPMTYVWLPYDLNFHEPLEDPSKFNRHIVMVEDMFSAIRLSKHTTVLCLVGTPQKMPVVLPHGLNVTLWLDPDNPGQQAQRMLANELRYSCPVRTITGLPEAFHKFKLKDPKMYSDEDLKEIIQYVS